MGMPVGQLNARPLPTFTMRVGIPHRSGKLAFHAFERGYPVMVSASAFWDRRNHVFLIPDASDLYECDMALDSAGFSAMVGWQTRGRQSGLAGVFPWALAQYVELASLVSPAWWSAPDLCCEPEVARDSGEVRRRVDATATLLEATLQQVWHWQSQLALQLGPTAVANLLTPPVPILQGWDADDYLYSLEMTLQVWQRWSPWFAPPALFGIGSVCRRNLEHPRHGLYSLLRALDGRLPAGSRVHLFGVKGRALSEVTKLPWVASADSMAYDFSARVQARDSRQSCDMALRRAHMTRWMNGAARAAESAAGLFGGN